MTDYTYIPQKDSERFWTIKDIHNGKGFGVYCSKDITELGKFHNHSDKPTCKAVKTNHKYTISSINDMNAGKEITVNYNDYLNTLNIEQRNKDWKKGE